VINGLPDTTRLAFSPHLDVSVLDERRVLLVSEDRSFSLTGKLYVMLAAMLDGTKTIAQLVSALRSAGAPLDRIETALSTMLKKKYAAPVAHGVPAGHAALWTELDLDPAAADARVRATSVAVVGTTPVAATLSAALADVGFPLVGEADAALTLVLVDDYLERRLGDLDARMRAAGRRWMPIKPAGRIAWIGPIFRAGGPCWACLSKRLAENRPGELSMGDGDVRARVPRAVLDGTRTLAVNLGALELARATAGAEDAALAGDRILTLDLKSLEFTRHTVHRLPSCPACGEAPAPATDAPPIMLQSRPKHPTADGGSRTSSPQEALARLEPQVSPLTGIIAALVSHAPADGLPVYMARQILPVAVGLRENRLRGRAEGAGGKGTTDLQAKISCLAEAVERYSTGWQGTERRRRATRAEMGEAAVHPDAISSWSAHQYATREEWNKTNHGFNWVGAPFQDALPIDWSPVWSLTHGRTRWLPTQFCYFTYPGDPAHDFYRAESNGCASGSTMEEAILQGFMELVERDACALWWYNRVRRPGLDLDSFGDPFFRRARAFYQSKGRTLHALDLTTDLGLPVVAAVSCTAGHARILTGLGAHVDMRIAASRAVAEMNQMMVLDAAEAERERRDDDDQALTQWLREATVDNQPYVLPAPGRVMTAADYAAPAGNDILDEVQTCLAAVRRAGLEMLVLDLTRPEVGFPSVRVTVPGLRHFWARLAPGRLYDVPVALGWQPRPLAEEELNPIPFFL
jgi:ribosomal protein S12 methylthiotransferase accessory factor